jgi:hypothetical protein
MGSRVLLLILFTISLIPSVHSLDCGDVLAELRGFTSSAFAAYPELRQVKQDTLLLLYSQQRTACDIQLLNFASSSMEYLKSMDAAYLLVSSAELESQREGVKKAIEAERFISEMRSDSTELGILAQDAVQEAEQGRENFLLSQALTFESRAEKAESTRDKLANFELAIACYEAADALQANSLKVRKQSLEEKYIADIVAAQEYLSEAIALLTRAEKLEVAFLGFVDAYTLAREAKMSLVRAKELYQLHHEKEKLAEVEEVSINAEEVYSSTRKRILMLFAIVSLTLTSLSVYIHSIILSWERDTYDCYLGNELVGA